MTGPCLAQSWPSGFNESLIMGGWTEPVGATWDGNGRTYVWEKRGMVWIIENGVRLPSPLIDIRAEVGNWRDHGLLGFTLDPNFLLNGRIYLLYAVDRHHLMNFGTGSYSATSNQYFSATIMRISRYTAIGPSYNSVDAASRVVLLGETRKTGVPMLHESHSTGTLLFGQDGTLLATVGDGASYNNVDVGSDGGTYFTQALADSIIRPEENVGALRSQMVNSLNGKVLRIDPNTGDGVPSNPWYDATAPRSPRSRVWALGLRNPYRCTIKPLTGSNDPEDGDPGTLYIGDVQWNVWEDLNVCSEGGMNFGWPIYEGMEPTGGYSATQVQNLDAPNPLYDGVTCTQPYFRFIDLIKQDSPVHLNAHPNPCDGAEQVPNSIPKHFHSRPAIDWQHGDRSRCGAFDGNTAITFDLDDPASPVPGPSFGGYAAVGGPWTAGLNLPPGYQDCSFHADYVGGWIRRFKFDGNEEPVSVHDFASGLGSITWLGLGPDGSICYIRYNTNELRKIGPSGSSNLPPTSVIAQDSDHGTGPLTVNFVGSGSSDPENLPLAYSWDFGDGSPLSTTADPQHQFTAPPGVPTTYTVTLTIADNAGQQHVSTSIVSLNNTPPTVNITSIPADGFYPVGIDTTYQLQADVSDLEHGPGLLSYAWRTIFHHNTHAHPEGVDNAVSTSTVITGVGCDSETYYYVIELTVTDAGGLSTTAQRRLDPRCYAVAPAALITASVSAGPSPLSVAFSGTSSFDPGEIVAYHWDFGDGTSSNSATPSKVFNDTGDHQVTLTVTDDDGLTGQATKTISVITFDPPQCPGAVGNLFRQYWTGINGTVVTDLTNHPNFPNSPNGSNSLTLFQGPTSFGNNYGTRVRGYIVPPQSGTYVFNVTSDDASAVYVSLNAEPRHKRLICSVPGQTGETEYTKYQGQTSTGIVLQAGVYYYVELLHKDGFGADHFALRWQTPSNSTRTIIPGSALVSWSDCSPSVRVRSNLQGPWDPSVGLMRDELRIAGLVPTTEPFTALGFTQVGGGGETVSPARLAITGSNAVVDWVLLELRDESNPSQILATRGALLERDGDIVGTDGYARVLFTVAADNYFVAVRHRNHFGAMTLTALALNANEVMVDLTTGTTDTYGIDARVTLPNGRKALWSGNVLRDEHIRYVGMDNDRDPILSQVGGTDPTAIASGYLASDVNMDGVVRYVGANNDRDPILVNIGGTVPTATRLEQLP